MTKIVRRLTSAQTVKVCELIRANEESLKNSPDPKKAVLTLASTIGVELCPSNLRLLEDCLEINWILAKRKKPSEYEELCQLYDELDARMTAIEKALQARGLPR